MLVHATTLIPTRPIPLMMTVRSSMQQWGRCRKCWFVRSEESDGWIVEDDLPDEKRQAMHDAEQIRRAQAKTVEGRMRRASDVRVVTDRWLGGLNGKATAKNHRRTR